MIKAKCLLLVMVLSFCNHAHALELPEESRVPGGIALIPLPAAAVFPYAIRSACLHPPGPQHHRWRKHLSRRIRPRFLLSRHLPGESLARHRLRVDARACIAQEPAGRQHLSHLPFLHLLQRHVHSSFHHLADSHSEHRAEKVLLLGCGKHCGDGAPMSEIRPVFPESRQR